MSEDMTDAWKAGVYIEALRQIESAAETFAQHGALASLPAHIADIVARTRELAENGPYALTACLAPGSDHGGAFGG